MGSEVSLRVKPGQQPGGSAAAGESTLDAELSRICRIASHLSEAPSAVICIRGNDAPSVQGTQGLDLALRGNSDLIDDIIAFHSSGADRFLLPAPGSSALQGRLDALGALLSFASFAVRANDGGLSGALVVADARARVWEHEALDALSDLGALVATARDREARSREASYLEDALAVQAAYLDQLFESSPEAIAVLDSDNRIQRINEQYTRMYGYTAEEAIGKTPGELTVPIWATTEARELGRRVAKGEQVRVEGVRRRKDGTEIPVALFFIPIRVSRDQLGIYAISRDLSAVVSARQAVEQREERFRALIENATDLVAVVTAGGAIDYVTPSVERLLGHSPSKLLGTSAFALLHPDDAPEVIGRFTGVLRGECEDSVELRIRTSKDDWRTFEVRAKNLTLDKEVRGVVINARDVTDERSAKHMQRRLDAFLEATPDFIATFDPHGRALSVNRAFRALHGFAEIGTLADVTLADIFPREVTERLLNEGIPQAARTGAWSGETFLQKIGGEEIPISQVVLAHRAPSGALEFLSTLARDITAQKQAESALRHSEAHFRSLIENALDIITVVDVEGRILFISPSVKRIIGYEPHELVGQSIFSMVHPDEIPVAAENFTNVMQKDRTLFDPAEFRVRHKDGSWRRVESVSENLLDDPAVGGIVLNSRDVTERRRVEEALTESQQQLIQSQKMEAVGRLAGGIAHDFNNLLTAIKGFTELLLLDFEDHDPGRAFAAEIQGAATRAAGLTRQLLAFSRRQVLQPEVLDLNATVSEMEKMLERLVGEDLKISTALDPQLGRVKADPGQLEQVLMNLVVNARDAMPGGGEVRIRTSNSELTEADAQLYRYVQTGRYVLLEVSDSGSGMSKEVLDRVFEPFFTTKEPGKGTGLGLSTVYGIIKQSGGYVWADSELGVGTTFRVYLPQIEGELAQHNFLPSGGGSLEGTESILLVEDEVAVRVLVRRVLERAGYKVHEAANGRETLQLLREEPDAKFDLLLTDVVMPGMSGRELADQLCATHPDLRVLYMRAYTDEAIVHHGVLDPGVAFIEKPFNPELLLRKLREVLTSPSPRSL